MIKTVETEQSMMTRRVLGPTPASSSWDVFLHDNSDYIYHHHHHLNTRLDDVELDGVSVLCCYEGEDDTVERHVL